MKTKQTARQTPKKRRRRAERDVAVLAAMGLDWLEANRLAWLRGTRRVA